MDIYPSIDLKDGQCVRLLRGDFNTVHTVAEDPVAVAASYRDAGASVIHVVDLDGAKDGTRTNAALVESIVRTVSEKRHAEVQLGGGLRRMADLEEVERLGVRRFVIGSAALENPGFVKSAAARYGNRVVIGIDAKDGTVRSHGWTGDSGREATAFARDTIAWGIGTLIYTDIDTDGAQAGPSVQQIAALREALPGVF